VSSTSRLVLAVVMLGLAAGEAGAAQAAGPPAQRTPPQSAAAERRLVDAARRNPGSVEAHHALGTFYVQQGRLEAAIPHLERAQTIDPAHYASGYDLALALLETGRLDRARAQVQRMLRAHETAELHNLIGDIDERAGELVRAAES
jgi:Flp pilus assembly protein TadD